MLNDMNKRIEYLEDFAYYHTTECELAQESNEQDTEPILFSGQTTPPPGTQSSSLHPFDYQRKHQAISPLEDIRQSQANLNDNIARLDSNMNELISTFHSSIDIIQTDADITPTSDY